MIGHTKATAGVAGLIKAALALHHRVLPPTLGVTAPNPKADFPASPFYVNTETRPWIQGSSRTRAARGSARSASAAPTSTPCSRSTRATSCRITSRRSIAGRPSCSCGAATRGSDIAEALDALAGELKLGAEPSLADLAYTLALRAGAGRRRQGDARGRRRLARRARRKLRRRAGSDRLRQRAPAHSGRRPLRRAPAVGRRQGRLPLPGPGLAVREHGPRARGRVPGGPRVLRAQRPRPRGMPRAAAEPATSSRRRRSRPRTRSARRRRSPRPTSPSRRSGPPTSHTSTCCARSASSRRWWPATATASSSRSPPQGASARTTCCAVGGARPLHPRGRGRGARRDGRGRRGAGRARAAAGRRGPRDRQPQRARADGRLRLTAAIERAVALVRRARICGRARCRSRAPSTPAMSSPPSGGSPRCCSTRRSRRRASPSSRTRRPSRIRTIRRRSRRSSASTSSGRSTSYARSRRCTAPAAASSSRSARAASSAGSSARILGDRPHLAVAVDQPGRPGLAQLLHCLAALAAEGVPLEPERLFRGRSVKRLNLSGLEPVEERARASSALWLVDGGRARPVAQFAHEAAPPSSPRLDGMTMNTRDSEQPVVSRGEQAPPAQPAPGMPSNAGPAHAGERVGDVMNRHLQLMQHFLDTQKTVVLAYLGQPRATEAIEHPGSTVEHVGGNGRVAPPPQSDPPTCPRPERDRRDGGDARVSRPSRVPEPEPREQRPPLRSPADIGDRLLEIVSERTGYPPRHARARRRPRGGPGDRLDQAGGDRRDDDPDALARETASLPTSRRSPRAGRCGRRSRHWKR